MKRGGNVSFFTAYYKDLFIADWKDQRHLLGRMGQQVASFLLGIRDREGIRMNAKKEAGKEVLQKTFISEEQLAVIQK